MPVNRQSTHCLLKPMQKNLTFKHMIKADDIQAVPYDNPQDKGVWKNV